MKHRALCLFILIAGAATPLAAQLRPDGREETVDRPPFQKVAAPIDRAQNVININQLGQVVTNMGQWHPYTGTFPRVYEKEGAPPAAGLRVSSTTW